MNLTLQDLANIHPALIIAIETHGTNSADKRVWLDVADKIVAILQEASKPSENN